nr:MAG TPA: hypothetical protein [Caudoviricetes sp.]
MHKIREKYEDYDGNERVEEFYFNLTKAEITDMELTTEGGMSAMLNRIIAAKDTSKLIAVFKDLILRSYGQKSPDGRRFIKSDELTKEFTETPAYSQIYLRLATDDKAATEFVNNVIPKDLQKEVKAAQGNVIPAEFSK